MLHQLILITHRVSFVYEIAERIIVEDGFHVSALTDALKVSGDYGVRSKCDFGFFLAIKNAE